MKKWMGGWVLMVFMVWMGAGVAWSQGASSSSPEALEKGKVAEAGKNKKEAEKWYRSAAKQGNAEAQYELGNLLLNLATATSLYNTMKGINDDPKIVSETKEGMDWLRKSADQGYSKAEYSLGYEYYNGTNVPVDKAKGLLWLRKAATHGNESAKKLLANPPN